MAEGGIGAVQPMFNRGGPYLRDFPVDLVSQPLARISRISVKILAYLLSFFQYLPIYVQLREPFALVLR